jgi:hypothetical protein
MITESDVELDCVRPVRETSLVRGLRPAARLRRAAGRRSGRARLRGIALPRHAGATVRRYLPPKTRPMIATTGPGTFCRRPARNVR